MNRQGFLPFFWVLFSEEGLNGRVELAVHLGVGQSLGAVPRTARAAEAERHIELAPRGLGCMPPPPTCSLKLH